MTNLEHVSRTAFDLLQQRVIANPWIPHSPTIRQAIFLTLPTLEAFYGGAAGGGKSDALLMAALMYVDVPGYAALILRQSYTDLCLPGALIPRSQEWLAGTKAVWSEQKKTWTFPSGATLSFGYLESENDKYRYQSSEFQFIGFDELTQFSETRYRYMFSRVRRLKDVDVPLRVRSGSNPGGMGHDWVKGRFVKPGSPARPYIPARLADNPYLDQDKYLTSLQELDITTRRQLAEGDWEARPSGSKFRREWFRILDAAPRFVKLCRYWDLAATEAKPGKDPDWTAGALVGRTSDGLTVICDIRRIRATPKNVERLIAQTAALDKERYGSMVQIRMEQEPGSSGVNVIDHYQRTILPAYDFKGIKTTGAKELRANPLSAQAEAGNVALLPGSWNIDFLDEAEAFPTGSHDDQVDAVSGAYGELHVTIAAGTTVESDINWYDTNVY